MENRSHDLFSALEWKTEGKKFANCYHPIAKKWVREGRLSSFFFLFFFDSNANLYTGNFSCYQRVLNTEYYKYPNLSIFDSCGIIKLLFNKVYINFNSMHTIFKDKSR